MAEKLGILHEDYIITVGKSKGINNMQTDDSKMDIVNNAWGVNMARKNPNLDYLQFEELFFNDVKSQNTTIMIFDQKTIPKETLRTKEKRRNDEILNSWKNQGTYHRD